MPTCGHCKEQNQSIEHIRGCAAQQRVLTQTLEPVGLAKKYVEKRDFQPMALHQIPDSHYALIRPSDGKIQFFEIQTGKGKWAGVQFVSRLEGGPGDWKRYPVRGMERKRVLDELDASPKEAAIRFSQEHKVCAVCGSPLSDPESLAAGLGPICAKRF